MLSLRDVPLPTMAETKMRQSMETDMSVSSRSIKAECVYCCRDCSRARPWAASCKMLGLAEKDLPRFCNCKGLLMDVSGTMSEYP